MPFSRQAGSGWRPSRGQTSGSSSGHRGLLDPAVAAVTLLIREDRFQKVLLAEVRPQRVGDPDLGIRDLTQQEVADAHLAARPDQEIRIRLTGGVEKVPEVLFVQIRGGDA